MEIDSSNLVDHISWIIAAIALFVSVFSVWLSLKISREASKSQLLDQQYDAFNELAALRLDNWMLNHMFEIPENYEHIRISVRSAVGPTTSFQREEYHLKERAIAMCIFQIYEHTYYQYMYALETRSKGRAEFLEEVLSYFSNRLLQNPRLLFYWHEKGGNLSVYFERGTIEYYQRSVFKSMDEAVFDMDLIGPFGAE
ncbi:hypothetical protein [Sessilibacter sp. MAH4]